MACVSARPGQVSGVLVDWHECRSTYLRRSIACVTAIRRCSSTRLLEHEPGRRLVAVKNITVNEEFFQGHFPGAPLLPAVLMVESLSQVAAILVRDSETTPQTRVYLRGVNGAKFRRQVVPGDRLRLEITAGPAARRHCVRAGGGLHRRAAGAECELVLGVVSDGTSIHPSANVHPAAKIGAGHVDRPARTIGPDVLIGAGCSIGASSVIDGWTEIGDGTEIYPFASIGLVSPGPEIQGRADAARGREAQRVS